MKEKELQIMEDAICVFGKDAQIDVVIEELSELIKALIKYRRYPNQPTRLLDIYEELADVEIGCQYLRLIHNLKEDIIDSYKYSKLERLKHTIKHFKGGE